MRTRRHRIWAALALAFAACVVTTAAASAGDPSISAGKFQVTWSSSDPEEITGISWNGSGNLTNTWTNPGQCPGNPELEFFGNGWGTGGFGTHPVLVGGGSTGTWGTAGAANVKIQSAATGCPPQTGGTPVTTSYHFFTNSNQQNRFLVTRTFSFSTPFTNDLRPYIPRLYPNWQYTQVLHPDASGGTLLTEDQTACDAGCEITNWNGTWFAVNNPTTKTGMIVRELSAYPAALWVDQDGGSGTSASSVLLLEPAGGFTGTITDSESFCFYDSSTWTPGLTLPNGC